MGAVKTLQIYLNQNGNALEVDGVMGKKTLVAIETLHVPNWVKTALKEVGVKEIVGAKHNARVVKYHEYASGKYTTDEIAWCGSAMAFVMATNGYETPAYPERAKSWLSWGKSSVPCVGALAVKSRIGGGHVTLIIGKNREGDLWCVGGNQNNEFNIQLYKKEVFLDFRVPTNYHKEVLPYYALSSIQKVDEA